MVRSSVWMTASRWPLGSPVLVPELEAPGWQAGPTRWREAFFPEPEGAWADFPFLAQLFAYNGSGVMPGRTWVIAPDVASLARRWARLVGERDAARKEVLFHPHLRRGRLAQHRANGQRGGPA